MSDHMTHDYPACALFGRGPHCTCVCGEPHQVNVDGIGPMWRHWCKGSRRALTLPLGELCDRCGIEPPAHDSDVASRVTAQSNCDGVAESPLDGRNGNADWTKAGTGVNSPTSPALISRKAPTEFAGSNPAAVAPPPTSYEESYGTESRMQLPAGYEVVAEDVKPDAERGWKCGACGFKGFWHGGPHCMFTGRTPGVRMLDGSQR